MKKTIVAPLMLCLMLAFAGGNLCVANPYGPPNAVVITIQNDGTVNPADSPLEHVGGGKYILTEDLIQKTVSEFERYVYRINIEKDNVILDGANHTIEGYGRIGIEITYQNNVTVQNVALADYELSVEIWCSSNIQITDCIFSNGKRVIIVSNSSQVVIARNVFTENYEQPSIWLKNSNYTTVYGNTFTCRPLDGWLVSALDIEFSQNNLFAANTFTKYYSAVTLLNSSGNYFCQNNFLDNQNQV
jgi:parallel beta-helix repeat protein